MPYKNKRIDSSSLVGTALSLLETDVVKEKIVSIIDEYYNSTESALDSCDKKTDMIAELQDKLNKYIQDNEKKTLDLNKAKDDLKKANDNYYETVDKNEELIKVNLKLEKSLKAEQEKNEPISTVIFLFDKYNSLSEEIRAVRLANVISCKSIISFIISCSNYDNLLSIWDFCKSMILSENNGRNTELEVLKDIFYYFFNQLGNSMNTPKFKLLDTQVGETFDDQYHIRGRNSKVSGRITDVILNGVVQCNNNVCKRQSIVAIREK